MDEQSGLAGAMSALPPEADIERRDWNVRFGPKADIAVSMIRFSIADIVVRGRGHKVTADVRLVFLDEI